MCVIALLRGVRGIAPCAGLAVVMMLAPAALSQPAPSQQTAPSQQAVALSEEERKLPAEVRERLLRARAAIAAENKNYTVGATSVSGRSMKFLAGEIEDPMTVEQRQLVNRQAEDLLDLDAAVRDEHYKGRPRPKMARRPVCDKTMKSFDWRKAGKVTPVRQQGACGSCWSFSAYAAYESSYLIINKRSANGSEQDLLDCAKADNGKDAGSCNGGLSWMAFQHIVRAGGLGEDKAPYKGKEGQCKSPSDRPIRAVTWGFVNPAVDLPAVDELKAALCEHGVLSVSMRIVSEDFHDYKSGIYDETVAGPSDGTGHAVALVGWDDTKDNGKGKKGAWIVKNSWGTGWGEEGYVWMSYGSNLIGRTARWIEAIEDKLIPTYMKLKPERLLPVAVSSTKN